MNKKKIDEITNTLIEIGIMVMVVIGVFGMTTHLIKGNLISISGLKFTVLFFGFLCIGGMKVIYDQENYIKELKERGLLKSPTK